VKTPIVRIILDETSSHFECGSVMKGQVEVTVMEECPPRNLIVAVGYQIKSEGSTLFCDTEKRQLFSGVWSPGIFHYPFSLSLPEGCNYAGTLMKVEWFLRANTENPEKKAQSLEDQKGDIKKINPLPAEVSVADRERNKASEILRRESPRPTMGCLLTSATLVLTGILLTWLGAGHDAELPGIIMAVLGLLFLGIIFRQKFIDRKIMATDFWIGSTVVWPGLKVPCDLTVQAKVPLEVEKATLTFEGWEQLPDKKHYVHREEKEIELPAKTLPAGVPISLSGSFLVPNGPPCTMEEDDEVKFLWQVKLQLKIKGSPDWFDREPITVLPRKENEG
jgi:hypothetical protein